MAKQIIAPAASAATSATGTTANSFTNRPNVRQLHLVRPQRRPNQGLIDSLTCLLKGAIDGDLTGMVFAASLNHRDRFISDVIGECYDRPTYALGLVSMLTDELKGVQHAMDPHGPR